MGGTRRRTRSGSGEGGKGVERRRGEKRRERNEGVFVLRKQLMVLFASSQRNHTWTMRGCVESV